MRVEFEQSVPFLAPSDNVSSFDDNHDCMIAQLKDKGSDDWRGIDAMLVDNVSLLLSSESVPSASGRMRKERTKEKPRPRALNI